MGLGRAVEETDGRPLRNDRGFVQVRRRGNGDADLEILGVVIGSAAGGADGHEDLTAREFRGGVGAVRGRALGLEETFVIEAFQFREHPADAFVIEDEMGIVVREVVGRVIEAKLLAKRDEKVGVAVVTKGIVGVFAIIAHRRVIRADGTAKFPHLIPGFWDFVPVLVEEGFVVEEGFGRFRERNRIEALFHVFLAFFPEGTDIVRRADTNRALIVNRLAFFFREAVKLMVDIRLHVHDRVAIDVFGDVVRIAERHRREVAGTDVANNQAAKIVIAAGSGTLFDRDVGVDLVEFANHPGEDVFVLLAHGMPEFDRDRGVRVESFLRGRSLGAVGLRAARGRVACSAPARAEGERGEKAEQRFVRIRFRHDRVIS